MKLDILFSRYLVFIFLSLPFIGLSQNDTLVKKGDYGYKNTIRYNLTNQWFFGTNNVIFGYERVIKPYQTASINFGLASFPELGSISLDSIELNKASTGSGFNLAFDYRFYLKNENRHLAPRGIYVGPYFSYNLMKRRNTLDAIFDNGSEVNLELNHQLTIIATGFELGYQFVFLKDRLALDLILLGPGVGFYQYNANLGTSLSLENEGKVLEAIKNVLIEKYPGANIVFEGHSMRSRDVSYSANFNYRFVFQVGYRF
jgi:hypothetical protein